MAKAAILWCQLSWVLKGKWWLKRFSLIKNRNCPALKKAFGWPRTTKTKHAYGKKWLIENVKIECFLSYKAKIPQVPSSGKVHGEISSSMFKPVSMYCTCRMASHQLSVLQCVFPNFLTDLGQFFNRLQPVPVFLQAHFLHIQISLPLKHYPFLAT